MARVAGSKPVIPSRRAILDVLEAAGYYEAEAGEAVADRFIAAVHAAFEAIGRVPGIGSPRYAHELGLPELRSWRLKGYPYLVFYIEHEDALDVIRVLHGARDIPATLAEPEAPDP